MDNVSRLMREAESHFGSSDFIANADRWGESRSIDAQREAMMGLGYAILALVEQNKPENPLGDAIVAAIKNMSVGVGDA